jgi:hypothetical protein
MKQIDLLLASGLLTAASEGGRVFYRAPRDFRVSPKTQPDTVQDRGQESGAFWKAAIQDFRNRRAE